MHLELPFSEAVMRRSIVALVPILGLVALGACNSDRDTTAPRYIAPSQSISANLTLACSFNTMSQDAKNYFATQDPVFTMIGDMKTLYRTSVAAATPKGFDILARVAAARTSGAEIGTATAGGTFVLDVVGCMDVGPVPDKFTPAAALLAGVFEVRGNSGPTGPALAMSSSPGVAATLASPLWGAEPANGDWTRAAATYGRYLVYGYPLGASVLTSGFELGTLPASLSGFVSTSTDAFRTGLCIAQAQGGTTANRLVHLGAIVTDPNSVLQQGTNFCVNHVVSTGSTTWLAGLMNRAASWLAPRRALAQPGFDGIGGLPDGWSPFNPNGLQGSSITITITQQPANTRVGLVDPVTVNVSDNGLVVPGALVTLSVFGNNGVPANAVITSGGGPIATDKNGNATFPMTIGKAGGYTLSVSGTLSGVPTGTVLSQMFNVKNP